MPINSRAKGQRGERQVIDLLQPIVDRVHAQHSLSPVLLQRNTLQAHMGGEDIANLHGFSVEVKFCETITLKQWWEQCLRQAKARQAHPVLFYRKSKQKWAVKTNCFCETPKSGYKVSAAVEMTIEDFLTWFEAAYTEHAACLS